MPLYARLILDIKARELDRSFDYAVPPQLASQAQVGCCALVDFAHRPAVGYILALDSSLPAGVDPAKVKPLSCLLSEPLFGPSAVTVARWIAREYAAPLLDAVKLFCPPGFSAKTVRDKETGQWSLSSVQAAEVEDTWVSLTEEGTRFEPAPRAARQRAVVQALSQGPVRQSELGLTVSNASTVVKALEQRGVVQVEKRRRLRGTAPIRLRSAAAPRRSAGELTAGQRAGLAAIARASEAERGDVVLLDGVTGSGKTEVYLSAIERVREQGKDAVVLVPEISLTPQTVGRFRSRFGDQVAILHSRLSEGERYDQWDLVRSGYAHVVVGARSALFAPLANPGLYVIDEEHESSYKQSSAPRYHAREVAAYLAQVNGAALVLGSATPSLESLARCGGSFAGAPGLHVQSAQPSRSQRWTCVSMPERPSKKPLPPVEIVDMAQEFSQGWRSMFSRSLTEALTSTLERGEKAVLMLNQRGFARWLLCRDCGYVPKCTHCSTSLTYHERGHVLMCHTCGARYPVPAQCPECGSRYLKMSGMGTQQVEDRLREQLAGIVGPQTEVVRMDADSTRAKGGHEKCLEQFDAAERAVLLGTQMIAKGLDFPQVTLVGVINADTVLKVCDFRAAERTYGLLEQVAGRAGRGERPGKVVIQTYQPTHPAILAAARHNRQIFLDHELPLREEALYPPFVRLANILLWGPQLNRVQDACARVAKAVIACHASLPGNTPLQVLGPVACALPRVQDRHRWHVLVKAPHTLDLGPFIKSALATVQMPAGTSLAVDIDPYDLM